MKWTEMAIETIPQGLDTLVNVMTMLGYACMEIEDEQDFKSFLENSKKYWDYVDEKLLEQKKGVCRVKIYVQQDSKYSDSVKEIKDTIINIKEKYGDAELGTLDITETVCDEEEWSNSWKKYYKPFNVGKRLYVCPEWEKPQPDKGRVVFLNNPGMAFGSGSHASTRMCMELLDEIVSGGEDVLDLGCGSGILSIISSLLGAKEAIGVDIDEKAIDASQKNENINNINNVSFFEMDVTENTKGIDNKKYDIICANIVADVIMILAPVAAKLLKDKGTFITSGIIAERCDEVIDELLKHNFEVEKQVNLDGWCALKLKIKNF